MKPQNIWSDEQLGISGGSAITAPTVRMKAGGKVVIGGILEREVGREVSTIA